MCSVFRRVICAAGAALVAMLVGATVAPGEQGCPCAAAAEATAQRGDKESASESAKPRAALRVWADPDNLPFSNREMQGFENKIAQLVARELGVKLEYTWLPQRRGFFRESLKNGDADLVLSAPNHFDMAMTTRPYYRSSYVFVYRKDKNLHLKSFDDPALKKLKIGLQLIGSDTPASHALARRGLIDNVVGFP